MVRGALKDIEALELVLGDIIQIRGGFKMPADIRMLPPPELQEHAFRNIFAITAVMNVLNIFVFDSRVCVKLLCCYFNVLLMIQEI